MHCLTNQTTEFMNMPAHLPSKNKTHLCHPGYVKKVSWEKKDEVIVPSMATRGNAVPPQPKLMYCHSFRALVLISLGPGYLDPEF